ncbi:MAG: SirB2 family protein [Candidatus Competibacteraceae bacterium]
MHGWLTAKVLGLAAYIILGSIALKRGQTKPIRAAAWILALATFGYIVSVAVTHAPSGSSVVAVVAPLEVTPAKAP